MQSRLSEQEEDLDQLYVDVKFSENNLCFDYKEYEELYEIDMTPAWLQDKIKREVDKEIHDSFPEETQNKLTTITQLNDSSSSFTKQITKYTPEWKAIEWKERETAQDITEDISSFPSKFRICENNENSNGMKNSIEAIPIPFTILITNIVKRKRKQTTFYTSKVQKVSNNKSKKNRRKPKVNQKKEVRKTLGVIPKISRKRTKLK